MIELYALHGFLGRPADWDGLFPARDFELRALDLFSSKYLGNSECSLESVAREINDSVIARPRRPRILLGYSLGGRIGMHALTLNPDLWDGAVFVSSHPGFADDDALSRETRVAQDETWARRFESDEWTSTVSDWNAQPVFSGMPSSLEREASNFDRLCLAQGMRSWSLGRQADQRARLKGLKIPVLWLAGSRDSRYTGFVQECAALSPVFRSAIVPGAGHRVPWEQPSLFLELVQRFIDGESYAAGSQKRTLDQAQGL